MDSRIAPGQVGLGGRQAAAEGVHLAGSFQGWDPAATATWIAWMGWDQQMLSWSLPQCHIDTHTHIYIYIIVYVYIYI